MPNPLPRITLTTIQQEAITGSLLGDGTINRRKDRAGNSSYAVVRALKDVDYLKYEVSIFSNCVSPDAANAVKCASYFDDRVGFNKISHKCRFATVNNIVFTELHDKWYRQNSEGKNIKIVPANLQLSSITIAHWFADDGSIWLNSSSRIPRFEMRFSTEGFTKDEVKFLISLLQNRYNEKFAMYQKNRGPQQYVISGLDTASRAIIYDIDGSFHMTRKRLWDDPNTRYYINPPEKQIDRKVYLQEKKQKFFDTISLYTEISARDLAKQLNYWFVSADGTRDDPDYHMLHKMIKPYLESGQIIKIKEKSQYHNVIFKINKFLQKVDE